MINNINEMPICMIKSVWSFFRPLELIQVRAVCKNFKDSIDEYWLHNFGISREIFIKTIKWTPSEEFKSLIVKNILDLDKIEEISRILKIYSFHSRFKRIIELFSQKEISHILKNYPSYICFLISDSSVMALKNSLITSKDIIRILDLKTNHLIPILSNNGIIALKKKLITLEEMISMPIIGHLTYLLSDEGIKALENGDVIIKDVIKMPISDLNNLIRGCHSKSLDL